LGLNQTILRGFLVFRDFLIVLLDGAMLGFAFRNGHGD
jgi:hypothetical protein